MEISIDKHRVQIDLYPVQFYTWFIPSSTDFQQWYQSSSMGKGKSSQQMVRKSWINAQEKTLTLTPSSQHI